MINPILHIATRAAWDAAQHMGEYRPASLDTEGFIHCSTPEQVVRTANRFFRGQHDLLLLLIDPAKLHAPVRYEAAADDLFPHVYGVINLDAVIDVLPFAAGEDGTFTLPPTLA